MVATAGVDIGTCGDKHFDDVHVAVPCGEAEWRAFHSSRVIGVRSMLHQQAYKVQVAVSSRGAEGRAPVTDRLVYFRTSIQQ